MNPQEVQEVPGEEEEAVVLGRTASVAEPSPGRSQGVGTYAALPGYVWEEIARGSSVTRLEKGQCFWAC